MKNYANIFIGALVTLVIVLGVAYFNTPKPTPPYGAFPGPDVNLPYFAVNGVQHYYYHVPFNTGSTTLCSIKTPSATTTILQAKASIVIATSSALFVEWGTDKVNYTATTTSLGRSSIAANTAGTVFASSSGMMTNTALKGGSIDDASVLLPNTYLNFNYGGAGLCTVGGTCNGFTGSACNIELLGL